MTTANIEHEQLIQRLLSDRKKVEALAWLKGSSENDERTIGACETNAESVKLIETLYHAGAREIFAVHIHRRLRDKRLRTGKLVVELPDDTQSRKAIFDWCRQQGDSLGFTPDPDRSESHLFLLFD